MPKEIENPLKTYNINLVSRLMYKPKIAKTIPNEITLKNLPMIKEMLINLHIPIVALLVIAEYMNILLKLKPINTALSIWLICIPLPHDIQIF